MERRSYRPSVFTLQDILEVAFVPRCDGVTGQERSEGDRVTGQGVTVSPLGVSEGRPILTKEHNNTPNNKDLLSEPKVKPKKFKFEDDDIKIANWMLSRVKVINPTAAKPNYEN